MALNFEKYRIRPQDWEKLAPILEQVYHDARWIRSAAGGGEKITEWNPFLNPALQASTGSKDIILHYENGRFHYSWLDDERAKVSFISRLPQKDKNWVPAQELLGTKPPQELEF